MDSLNMRSIMKKVKACVPATNSEVPIQQLFPDAFISAYSDYANIDALLSSAGITDQESFEAWIKSGAADSYIRKNTMFHSWNTMYRAAMHKFEKGNQEKRTAIKKTQKL